MGGFGTQTAALCAGGGATAPLEPAFNNNIDEYNGTAWTSVNA